MSFKPSLCERVQVNALAKVVGFLQELWFPPTEKGGLGNMGKQLYE